MNKEKLIVVDLDGTLVDSSIRTEIHTCNGKIDFANLHEGILKYDSLIEQTYDIVFNYIGFNSKIDNKDPIIFLTGRNLNAKKETIKFLSNHGLGNFKDLIMRTTNDFRPAWKYKIDHLTLLNKKYDIEMYIDDDLSCILEAQKLGIFSYWQPSRYMDKYSKQHILEYLKGT